MAFSQATLINRIRVRSGTSQEDKHDICTEAMDTTETGLDVADTTIWAVGDTVQFEDDGELCLVTALASATTLTVIRNYLFSVTTTAGTGTSHSINADIVQNPIFSIKSVKEAVEEVLRSLWPWVYTKVTADLTPSTTTSYYSVAATFEELSDAMQRDTDATIAAPRYYGGRRSLHPIELLKNLPDNFPTTEDTGRAVRIPRVYNTTNTIRVNGIARITAATSGSPVTYTDLTDGLEVDCVVDLATGLLLETSDTGRSTGDDVSMSDQSVVPGRRSAIGQSIWHRRGMAKRHQWERELRQTLPRMAHFGGIS